MKRPKDLAYAKWLSQYYLSFRMHSRAELLLKLQKKEVPKQIIYEALDWCEREGYIDDLDYAKRYIKDAARLKKRGKPRITDELYAKRIKKEIIERAFLETCGEVDFDEALQFAYEAKARNLDLTQKKDRDKLISHLVRKGFKIQEILKTINDKKKTEPV